jgi:hypothetical protein
VPKEKLVKHKAFSIASGAIHEALQQIALSGFDSKITERSLHVIMKYRLMMKDVIVD